MGDEVNRSFVQKHVLLFEDCLFLTVGSDDRTTSHTFVEVGVDRAPESGADFVKLVVSVHVRLYEAAHDPKHQSKTD